MRWGSKQETKQQKKKSARIKGLAFEKLTSTMSTREVSVSVLKIPPTLFVACLFGTGG